MKQKKMTCHQCGKNMRHGKLKFNEHSIDGWTCSCGEIYYDSQQAQRILLLNKLRKETVRAKLGKVRSNLVLRLPKNVQTAFDLEKGEDVLIKVEGDGFKIVPA